MATIPASENEFPQVLFAEGAAAATPGTGLVVVYAKSDGLIYTKDDAGVETAIGATAADLAAHLADTSDAHDASAVSVLDTAAVFTGTDVETVLKELYDTIAGGGISPTIFAAKGDILGASANDTPAITSVGSNGAMLVADSSQTAGLRWWKPAFATYTRNSGNYTISTGTFTDIDSTNLSFTITTLARRVKMAFVGTVNNGATANQQIYLDVTVDGTQIGGATGLVAFRNANDTTTRRYNGSFVYLTDVLTAGSHTFKFQWAAASGTATIVGDGTNGIARWWVEETPFDT